MHINFQTNFNYNKQQPISKNKKVSFSGVQSEFSKELKDYALNNIKDATKETNLIEMFKNLLSKVLNPENLKGSGEFGAVYKIDDEFVLKKAHNAQMEVRSFSLNDNPILDKFKTFYGDYVAKFDDIKILKNATITSEPVCAGVKEGLENNWQKMSYYRDVYLKKFAQLPQDAFDDVAADFKTASSMRKSFDTINPNNFIADGDKIKIVDDMVDPNDKFFNSLAGMVKVFLTSFDRNTKAEYDVMAVGSRRNLLRKIILAGEKNELNFGFTMPEKQELNDALALCDIQVPWRDIQADLCNFRRRYPNIDERLKKVNEYIDELEDTTYNYFMD